MNHRFASTRSVASIASLAFCWLLAAPAYAQGTEATVAARRLLLAQAQQARDAGNHAAALDAAEHAGAIQMTPSVRMFIAEEHRALGHLAPSLGAAELCVSETERDPSAPDRDVILATCRGLVRDLRPRVGTVTVQIPSPAPAGLRVTVSGGDIPAALYGIAYPVTPGAVVIDARADGRTPFHRELTVGAGQAVTVDVSLGATVAAATPEGGGANSTGDSSSGPLLGPVAVAGVGVISFALAGVFYALREQARSNCTTTDTQLLCVGDEAYRQGQQAVTYNTATNVAIGVGIAGVAIGAGWFVLGRLMSHPAPAHARIDVDVRPVAGGAVFTVGGAF